MIPNISPIYDSLLIHILPCVSRDGSVALVVDLLIEPLLRLVLRLLLVKEVHLLSRKAVRFWCRKFLKGLEVYLHRVFRPRGR